MEEPYTDRQICMHFPEHQFWQCVTETIHHSRLKLPTVLSLKYAFLLRFRRKDHLNRWVAFATFTVTMHDLGYTEHWIFPTPAINWQWPVLASTGHMKDDSFSVRHLQVKLPGGLLELKWQAKESCLCVSLIAARGLPPVTLVDTSMKHKLCVQRLAPP